MRGLVRAGILTEAERDEVLAALDQVEARAGRRARSRSLPSDEDIHTAVERRVTELAGAAGAKLHTGRSRNDQVATDLRLYTKRSLLDGRRAGRWRCRRCCSTGPIEAGDAYLPGYTHLQRAQPVTLAHHLLAHGWALARDVDRLLDCRRRADVSPLGAGALAGSSIPLDPDGVAADLGLRGPVREQPRRGVRPRLRRRVAVRASRWSASTSRASARRSCCGRPTSSASPRLDDAYATGSSMLPQKKNPDIAELARGKAGRLIGDLTGLLATLKGLPLAYNRDLQEDKEPLFDAVDQVALALSAHDRALSRRSPSTPTAMQAAADTPVRRRHRPGRAAGRHAARRSARPTPSSGRWSATRSSDGVAARRPRGGQPGLRRRGRRRPARARGVRHAPHHARRRRPRAVAVQLERFRAQLQADRDRLAALRGGRLAGCGPWRSSTPFGSATARSTCSGSCSTPTTSRTATTPPTCGSGRSARRSRPASGT